MSTDTDQNAELVALMKLDLGISHRKKDALLWECLKASAAELSAMGIELDLDDYADRLLLRLYAEYSYEHPDSSPAMPRSLRLRLNNRLVNGGSSDV